MERRAGLCNWSWGNRASSRISYIKWISTMFRNSNGEKLSTLVSFQFCLLDTMPSIQAWGKSFLCLLYLKEVRNLMWLLNLFYVRPTLSSATQSQGRIATGTGEKGVEPSLSDWVETVSSQIWYTASQSQSKSLGAHHRDPAMAALVKWMWSVWESMLLMTYSKLF